MKYPVDTPSQLKMLVRALRKARGLSQAQVGAMLGVTQQRLAQIEARPEAATFDTVLRLIALLKGRMYVEDAAIVSGGAARKGGPKARHAGSNEDW